MILLYYMILEQADPSRSVVARGWRKAGNEVWLPNGYRGFCLE
jgi:hypothetical protein